MGQQGGAIQGWVHGQVSQGGSSGKVFTGVDWFQTEIPQAVQCPPTHTHAQNQNLEALQGSRETS